MASSMIGVRLTSYATASDGPEQGVVMRRVAICAVLLAVPGACAGAASTTESADAIVAIAEQYLDLRSDLATGVEVSMSAVPMTEKMAVRVEEEVAIVEERIDRLAALGESYTYADTQLALETFEVDGAVATAGFSEFTELGYAKVAGDEPASTAYQVDHELVFTRAADGGWLLAAGNVSDGMLPITMVDRSSTGTGDVLDADDCILVGDCASHLGE